MTMLTPQDVLKQESADVELLAGMMGGDFELEDARRVLRKHKGNVQKAADAILGGDRGEDTSTWWHRNPAQTSNESIHADPTTSSSVSQAPQASSSKVIDLTASDDEDMSRALQMSMETTAPEPTFGPSDRAPHPEWQMVPSNVSIRS
jgi:Ubiquitin interaction motif